jgi:DNA-binding NtrC family response regulator
MVKQKILIVDDEREIRLNLRDFLEAHDYVVSEAESCEQARVTFRKAPPDVAVLDYRLQDGNAIELLPQLREMDSSVPLVVLTAHGSIDLAVQAIKEGAEHFLIKPIELPALLVILQRLLEARRMKRRQVAEVTRESRRRVDPFFGESQLIRELGKQARRVLNAESPILIQGETGTGKSLLADWLHRHGPRADEAFVDLNCAGLPRDFLETELFGHAKGAFTGAVSSKKGLLEVAHGGTVFLDEIGDMDLQVQPKLLKVLEEKRFRRLGEVTDRDVDISLIAATHQNVGALVSQGKFRGDLYFRVSTIPLVVPPLRERGGDILMLARSLLAGFAADLGRGEMAFTHAAEQALLAYAWPGNIRELRNVIERAVLLSDGSAIDYRDLRFEPHVTPDGTVELSRRTLREVERDHIERVLVEEEGRVEPAAKRLGIPRSSLYQKLKVYGIATSKS